MIIDMDYFTELRSKGIVSVTLTEQVYDEFVQSLYPRERTVDEKNAIPIITESYDISKVVTEHGEVLINKEK